MPKGATPREITALETHALRRTVLRGGADDANLDWPEDSRPGAFHLGVEDARGEIIAVASFSEEPVAARPGATAWRLRGMAVAESHQGKGIGRAMLDEALRRVRACNATVLWCNARDSATSFYAAAGFTVIGDGFNTDETGLPHHVMVRDL